MQETKFRAWLKNEKKMVKVSELRDIDTDIKSDQNVIYFDFEKQEYCNKGFDEVELMQYTGLKDKNGKKIFDGDIVQECSGDFDIGVVEYDEFYVGFMLKFYYPGVKEAYEVPLSNYLTISSPLLKIIGNIYNNPELLEVE